MRRQLAFVTLAVASLVVIAFLVPLGVLVRNQAVDRALTRAERFGESVAAALAVSSGSQSPATVEPDLARAVLAAFGEPDGLSIVFPDGFTVGAVVVPSQHLAQARGGAAFTARTDVGAEVLIPVLVADGPLSGEAVVVRAFVAEMELSRGVGLAWLMLGGLGVFLVAVAVVAADRLGRSMVRPVTSLSAAARRLGDGDLDTRVVPEGPSEIAEVGHAFNHLAGRLEELLSAERESVADLSHRLRTPLTALRLQVETIADESQVAALLQDIGAIEAAVDRLINEAREPTTQRGTSDLAATVRHRAAFWGVLAEDQDRIAEIAIDEHPMIVSIGAEDVGALVDTLMQNIFGHTQPGVGYRIVAGLAEGRPTLVVEDDGPGFPSEAVRTRGTSGAGSTGLGLDIVSRIAESVGGEMGLGSSASGGARVTVLLGPPMTRSKSRSEATTRVAG